MVKFLKDSRFIELKKENRIIYFDEYQKLLKE